MRQEGVADLRCSEHARPWRGLSAYNGHHVEGCGFVRGCSTWACRGVKGSPPAATRYPWRVQYDDAPPLTCRRLLE